MSVKIYWKKHGLENSQVKDIISIDEQKQLESCPKIKKSILFTYD